MTKADKYFLDTIKEIKDNGYLSKNPRTKWSDGYPANYKSVFQKSFTYSIQKEEFPIQTLRKTPLKGAWYDMEAIYIKQTNIIEEMHPSIQKWWEPFAVKDLVEYEADNKRNFSTEINLKSIENVLGISVKRTGRKVKSIGNTYGHTVKRYNLMDKTLEQLENNPSSRRIIMNLWQEQQMKDDPKALVPCAFMTKWSIREDDYIIYNDSESYKLEIIDFSENPKPTEVSKANYVDLTLTQRSQDYLMTASINPTQYTMLLMVVCNHLTFKTGKLHKPGNLKYDIDDVHIYDRHLQYVDELLDRKPTGMQPKIKLICEPKDFYEHTWEDFEITGLEGIEDLSGKLEIAI